MEGPFAPIESARLHSHSSLSDSNNGSWHEIQELDPRHANQLNHAHLQIPYAAETNSLPSYQHHLHHNQSTLLPHQHHHHQLYPQPSHPYFHPASASAAAASAASNSGSNSGSGSRSGLGSSGPVSSSSTGIHSSVSVSASTYVDPTPSHFSSFSSPADSSPSGSPYHPYPIRHRPPTGFPLFLAYPASATPINVDPVGAGGSLPSSFNRYSTPPSSYGAPLGPNGPSIAGPSGLLLGSGSGTSSVPIAPIPPSRQSEMEVLASPQMEYMFTSGVPNPYGNGGSGGGSHFGTSGVGIHRRRPSLLTPASWPYAVRPQYGYGGAGNISNGHSHGHSHSHGHGTSSAGAGAGQGTMAETTYEQYGGVDETPPSAGGHYSGQTTPVWSHPSHSHSHPHAHAAHQGAGTPYYNPSPFNGRPMQPPLLLGTGGSMSNMSSGMMMDTPTATHPPHHQPPSNGSHAMGALTSPVDGYGSAPMGYGTPVGTPTTSLPSNGNIRSVPELETGYVEQMEHSQHMHSGQTGQHSTGYPPATNMGIYANEHERGGTFTAQRFDTSIPPTIPPIPTSPTTPAQPSHPTDHSSRPVLTTLAQGSESNTNGVQATNPGGASAMLPGSLADTMAAQSAQPVQALGNGNNISVNTVSSITPAVPLGHASSVGAVGTVDGQRPINDSANPNIERISTNTLSGVTDGSAAASASCASNKGEPSQDAVKSNSSDQRGEAVSNKLTGKANHVENDGAEMTAARRESAAEPILASLSNAAVHGDSSNGVSSDHSIQIRHHDEEPPSNSDGVAVTTLSGPTTLGSVPGFVPEGQERRSRDERFERFEGSANSIDSRANDTATATDKVNHSIVNGGLPSTFKAAESDPRLSSSEPLPLYKTAPDSYSSNNATATATTSTTTTTTLATATATTSTTPINTAAVTTSPSTEHHPSLSPQTPSHPSSNMQAVQAMPYQHGSHAHGHSQVPTSYPYHHHDPSYSSTTIPQASNFNPHLSASALRPEWRRSSYPEYPESQAQNGFPYSRGPQPTSTPLASSTSSATSNVTASGAPVRHSIEDIKHGRSMSPPPLGHHRHSLPNISSSEASAPTLASGHYTPGGRLVPAAFNSGPPSHRSGSSASSTPPSVAVTAPVAHYGFESTSSPHSHFEQQAYSFQPPSGVFSQAAGHRSGNESVFYPNYSTMGYHQTAGSAHFDSRIRHSSTSPAPPMITGGKRGRDDEWDMDGVDGRAQRRRLSHTPSGSMLGSDGGYATANGSPSLHSGEMGVIRMGGYAPPPSLKEMGIRNVIGESYQSPYGGLDPMMRARPAENGHDALAGLPGARGGPETSYSFISLPGNTVRKRPRRKFEEITRNYICNWPGCTKAYGTLNHLNAHVTMQKHGPKRVPAEFKEMRKVWRKQKREMQQQQAMHHQHDRNGVDMYHDDDGDNGDDDYDEGSMHTPGISVAI